MSASNLPIPAQGAQNLAANLAEALSPGSGKPGPVTGGKDFLALLNVSAGGAVPGSNTPQDAGQQVQPHTRGSQPGPGATDAAQGNKARQPEGRHQANTQDGHDNVRHLVQQPDPGHSHGVRHKSHAQDDDEVQEVAPARVDASQDTAVQAASAQNTSAQDNGQENDGRDQQQLRAAIKDALEKVSDILGAVLQQGAIPAAGSVPEPGTDTAGAVPSQPAATLALDANTLNLLKDIRALLGQLQQDVQDAGQDTGFQPGQGPAQALAALLEQQGAAPDDTIPPELLQQALDKFQQLQDVSGGKAEPVLAAATAQVSPAAQDDTKVEDAPGAAPAVDFAALKATIADLRQQLKVLHQQNEAIFSHVQQDASSLSADAQKLFSAMLPGGAQKDNTPVEVSYASAVAAQVQSAPALSTGGTQSDVLFTAGLALAQQPADNSGGSATGDGGQQGQPQAAAVIAPASAQPSQQAEGTTSSAFSRLLQQSSPSPLLEQVTFQVKAQGGDGSSRIAIQLHPADLGKLEIKLSVDAHGRTSVIVTADNQNTLNLLQRDAQGLARALTDAGLQADSGSLSFNLGGGQGGGQGFAGGAQGDASQAVATYGKTQPDDEADLNLNIISRSYSLTMTDGLDIKI